MTDKGFRKVLLVVFVALWVYTVTMVCSTVIRVNQIWCDAPAAIFWADDTGVV